MADGQAIALSLARRKCSFRREAFLGIRLRGPGAGLTLDAAQTEKE